MNIDSIIARLEAIPELHGKVVLGIPAQMESLGSAPYAWITDVTETGSESPVLGPVRQKIELRFEITVGARNPASMNVIRDAIMSAMLNFQPDNSYDPTVFRFGRMEFGDPGWFLWRDGYRTGYYRDTHN